MNSFKGPYRAPEGAREIWQTSGNVVFIGFLGFGGVPFVGCAFYNVHWSQPTNCEYEVV